MRAGGTGPATDARADTATSAGGGSARREHGLRLSGLGKALGGRSVVDALDLEVGDGEMVCLLGPSGCGKTTTLRMIGGFVAPDTGSVSIGGRDVTRLSPERRPTAMVFQNYALWPHMTVAGNVAYGLRIRRIPREQVKRRVDDVLALVNLTHHRDSYPARISGGEQQRAALARALVLRPQVLLLDEPLSNLDARLRVRVREDIREIQQELGITTVLVTHDQDEALSVADRVAVMNGGRIEQVSVPRELYRRPRTRFVAEFVGTMNLLPGRLVPPGALVGGVVVPVTATPGTATSTTPEPDAPGPGTLTAEAAARVAAGSGLDQPGTGPGEQELAIRPEDVHLQAAPAGVAGLITREIPRGSVTELVVALGTVTVRALISADRDPARDYPGGRVAVSFARVLTYRDGVLR